jgi:Rod binding domain-containing protein
MTIENISAVASTNQLNEIQNKTEVNETKHVLESMFFEMMLKSMFSSTGAVEGKSMEVTMFNDMYIQTMASELTKNHDIGFGKLFMENNKA